VLPIKWIRVGAAGLAMSLLSGCIFEEGPIGPPGTLNRITVSAIAGPSGELALLLPEVPNDGVMYPPGIDCYLSDAPANGEWQVMAEGYSTTSAYCTVSLDSGTWVARAYQVPDGWTALWVVTW
jgi:hypothetical protein